MKSSSAVARKSKRPEARLYSRRRAAPAQRTTLSNQPTAQAPPLVTTTTHSNPEPLHRLAIRNVPDAAARDRQGHRERDGHARQVEQRLRGVPARVDRSRAPHSGRPAGQLLCPSPQSYNYAVFSHTDTCVVLSLVNGSCCQPLQRSRSLIPARRAIRSSSDGQTYRNGIEARSSRWSTTR